MTPEQRLAELRELFLAAPESTSTRVLAVVSTVGPLLDALTRAIGAWTPSSALFFFGQIFLVAICLNYAVRLSQLTLQVKNLSQELAVLRSVVEQVEGSPR